MGINQHICSNCSKSFGTIQALTAHRRVHKNGDAKYTTIEESVSQMHDDIIREAISKTEERFTTAAETSILVVKVKRLPHGKNLPEIRRATPGSAAVDLYAAIDKVMWIGPSEQAKPPVPTGIAVEIPEGYVGKIAPRSGLAAKNGIGIMNAPGIIDSDYRGELMITLVNHSRHRFPINPGDRIAQMLIEKVEPVVFQYVDELSDTVRGEGGFGSTGVAMTETTIAPPPKKINFLDAAAKPDGVHVRKLEVSE